MFLMAVLGGPVRMDTITQGKFTQCLYGVS